MSEQVLGAVRAGRHAQEGECQSWAGEGRAPFGLDALRRDRLGRPITASGGHGDLGGDKDGARAGTVSVLGYNRLRLHPLNGLFAHSFGLWG